MHPIISKNKFGIRLAFIAILSLVASLLGGFVGASSATAAPVSSGVTTAYHSVVATKTTAKKKVKKAKKKAKKKTKKKVVKPAAPAYPAIAGIDPRCQIKGIALCASTGANKLFVVVNGQVTGTLDARFGRPGMNTPRGVFRVYYRNPAAYSYKYGARMPFSLFFIGGYAIHFSDEFAEWGWSSPTGGSHGCVNLRDMTGAKRVFDSSPIGTRVVVY